ncbi:MULTISPECIES: ABC transporter permease [unclassified Nitratiruptor]|uniref:ABC transporter permease n=1 Tax=unclassified Nitratiruptor TaxID=2624044 RepID=UPI0019169D35|nr:MULTISPECIES: ABC transporter permease [unclassified Nitratiruptor]BCD60449.1 putative ABC transport system permease protein [Nitratiruptor sp. YY08-10]BCD64062.1 putative ABC transport system permease protein [Nitratiruptor sp. YY08-14]
MDKRFVNYIVRRYLRFDKEQPFIFLSALLAFLGIAIGVMVLIVAMGIMNGMDKEFEKKLFTMNYPLTILPKFSLKIDETVVQQLHDRFPNLLMSPYVTAQVIYKKGNNLEGGVIFGVDFDKERQINDVLKQFVKQPPKKYEIIVGKELYKEFYLTPNEKIFVIFPKSEPSGFSVTPIFKRFRVKGYFHSGLIAYDKAYSYTTLESLRKILHMKKSDFSGIHIYSSHPRVDKKELELFLGDAYSVIGWWQLNGNFFSALAMEKRALFIVLMLIILVASLNIVSSLLMMVMNRRKEIALQLSLGATPKEIESIFFRLGSIIGGFGIVTGAILGLIGIYILSHFDIIHLPADVYGTSRLPIDLSIVDFFSVIAGAICITIISSIYPAKKSVKINIIDVLRNE